jgi:hypothetical protein
LPDRPILKSHECVYPVFKEGGSLRGYSNPSFRPGDSLFAIGEVSPEDGKRESHILPSEKAIFRRKESLRAIGKIDFKTGGPFLRDILARVPPCQQLLLEMVKNIGEFSSSPGIFSKEDCPLDLRSSDLAHLAREGYRIDCHRTYFERRDSEGLWQ